MTDSDRLELVGHLIAQGWHFGPAVILADGPDADRKLAMFRLMQRLGR